MSDANCAVDTGAHPVVYADDIEDVTFIGSIVRVRFYETRIVAGKLTKVVCLELIRPLDRFPSVTRKLHPMADMTH